MVKPNMKKPFFLTFFFFPWYFLETKHSLKILQITYILSHAYIQTIYVSHTKAIVRSQLA